MFIEDIRPVSRRASPHVRRSATYTRRSMSDVMPAARRVSPRPQASVPSVLAAISVPATPSPAPVTVMPAAPLEAPNRQAAAKRRRRIKKRHAVVTLGAFIGVAVLGAGLVASRDTHESDRRVSAAATVTPPIEEERPEQPVAPTKPDPPYAADMDTVIATYPDLQAAATLVDLSSGKSFGSSNAGQSYTAASTAKLATVFCYIHQVELGKAKLNQVIGGKTAQDSIMRMLVYSDNDAWDKLNRYLKFPAQQAYLNSLGLKATFKPNNLQFTTDAMAKMLTLLYQGKLMNDTNRAIVYDYMSRANMRNLILPALPAGSTALHKYGQIEGVLHDTSIVTYDDREYVWVVYTNNPKGTSSLSARQTSLIQALTTKVFANIAATEENTPE